jgi:lysophospholipase L1-like esterase
MNKKLCLWLLCLGYWVGLVIGEDGGNKQFVFLNQEYTLEIRFTLPNESDIVLKNQNEKIISLDFPGENLYPAVETFPDNFFVSWINYFQGNLKLCIYDHHTEASVFVDFPGFSFIQNPKIIKNEQGNISKLVFLANHSDNDDLFVYDFLTKQSYNVSQTPFSEKEFKIIRQSSRNLWLETDSLYDKWLYKIYLQPLRIEQEKIKSGLIPKKPAKITSLQNSSLSRTILCFGDSITAGKMRMFEIDGEDHPELAYPQLVRTKLENQFKTSFPTFVAAVPGEKTYGGAQRFSQNLIDNPCRYLLLMEGTNDAIENSCSPSSTLENLLYMVDYALASGIHIIISTIPPRADWLATAENLKKIAEINAGIIDIAQVRLAKYIDTHKTFMDTNPPDGWLTLLEDMGSAYDLYKGQGQHPSPAGHQVIANLFKQQIIDYPPAIPMGLQIAKNENNHFSIYWTANTDFDFSHYILHYGFSPTDLGNRVILDSPMFSYVRFPLHEHFFRTIYLQIQAVDINNNTSQRSRLFSSQIND